MRDSQGDFRLRSVVHPPSLDLVHHRKVIFPLKHAQVVKLDRESPRVVTAFRFAGKVVPPTLDLLLERFPGCEAAESGMVRAIRVVVERVAVLVVVAKVIGVTEEADEGRRMKGSGAEKAERGGRGVGSHEVEEVDSEGCRKTFSTKSER